MIVRSSEPPGSREPISSWSSNTIFAEIPSDQSVIPFCFENYSIELWIASRLIWSSCCVKNQEWTQCSAYNILDSWYSIRIRISRAAVSSKLPVFFTKCPKFKRKKYTVITEAQFLNGWHSVVRLIIYHA